jgi:hypothetical protein
MYSGVPHSVYVLYGTSFAKPKSTAQQRVTFSDAGIGAWLEW